MNTSRLAFIAAALLSAGAAQASFSGDFSAANWATSVSNGGNGSAVVSSDGSTLTLTSSDFSPFTSLLASDVSSQITLTQAVSLSFDWAYVSNDENGSSGDPFGYSVDGVFTQLSANDSWDGQSGNVTLSLNKGQTFAFVSRSVDSIFGASVATVTGFSATTTAPTPAVPEPSGAALAAGGLLALAAVGRRRVR
jgi:hypothetical protein